MRFVPSEPRTLIVFRGVRALAVYARAPFVMVFTGVRAFPLQIGHELCFVFTRVRVLLCTDERHLRWYL